MDSIKIFEYGMDRETTITTFNDINLDNFFSVPFEILSNSCNIKRAVISNGHLIMEILSDQTCNADICIYNISGKELFRRSIILIEGMNKYFSNVENISLGFYYVSVRSRLHTDNTIIYTDNFGASAISAINKSNITIQSPTMYRFTAFAKNRKPIVIDSVFVKSTDTISFQFGLEFPYKIVGVSFNLTIPNASYTETFYYNEPNRPGSERRSEKTTIEPFNHTASFVSDALKESDGKRYSASSSYTVREGNGSRTTGESISFEINNYFIRNLAYNFNVTSISFNQYGASKGDWSISIRLLELNYLLTDKSLYIRLEGQELKVLLSSLSDNSSSSYHSQSLFDDGGKKLNNVKDYTGAKLEGNIFLY